MFASLGSNRYQAGEADLLFAPRVRSSARGLILAHGAGGSAIGTADTTSDLYRYASTCAQERPVVAPDLGGAFTWGNPTSIARLETARTYLGTTTGATVDKVHLLGGSMGGTTVLDYAIANPSKVQSIALVIGVVHLDYVYQNNVNGQRPSIEAALGIAYPAAIPGSADPWPSAAVLRRRGIPLRAWCVTNDEYTPLADYVSFLEAAGGSFVNLGALGHTTTATAAVDAADLAAFFNAHD